MTDSSTPEPGHAFPAFALPLAGGGEASLADHAGRHLVVFFFPRADTPGCTTEAQEFSAALSGLREAGADVLGVSKDPVAKLEKFAAKRELAVPLASDAGSDLCERAGVWVEKSMYGKTYHGIQRATFLLGPDGAVVRSWPKVRVRGHVDEVVAAVRELGS